MGHAGDLTPGEAHRLLADDPAAVLVDVRTRAEWAYVGGPDLSGMGKGVVRAEWSTFPEGRPNPDFLADLEAAGVAREAPVVFLCRSGVRSGAAAQAATEAGWRAAYNVLEGFEGPLDDTGHRGTGGGWKVAGLPWRQT